MSTGSSSAPRVALVTGGAIRVGRAIVEHLAAKGFRVWVACRRSIDPARALVDRLGHAGLGPLSADLGDEAARADLAARVLDPSGPAGGRLDLLVNNAATFERGPFLSRTDADLRRVLEDNLVAPISLARRLAPALGAVGGSIVNIVDLSAYHPWSGYLDHGLSKTGLAMATRALALELAPKVRVNAVAPGTVAWPDDDAHAEGSPARARILAGIPLGEIGTPEDIAHAVAFLAESPHVDGHVLAVDGGRLARWGR